MWISWRFAPAQATRVRMWAVGSLHIWGSVTGYNGRPFSGLDVRGPFPPCSGQLISFAQIGAAKHCCYPSRFAQLATLSITLSKQSLVTRFALMAPRPSSLPAGRKRNANTHRLSTSKLSSIRSRSRRLDFNIAMASCESLLGASIQLLAAPMIETALQPLLERHGLSRSHIRFWVVHPGGRKVIDVQQHFGMTGTQLRFSRRVLRNYGNMSSPTVMFVLERSFVMAIRDRVTWGSWSH